MPHAKLTLTIPDDVWIGTLSRDFPDNRFRILSAFTTDDGGVGLVEISGPKLDELLSRMHAYDAVTDFNILQIEEHRALIQFETTFPLLLHPTRDSGVPVEMPFDIQDGDATLELTAPHEKLSALGDQLDAFDIPFSVDRVRESIQSEPLLTDRQHRLVQAAIEHGYYDTPRRCSLTDLADRVGLAKSTASETLHRAESRIVNHYAAEIAPPRHSDRLVQ